MAHINLELIHDMSSLEDNFIEMSFDMHIHVHQRIEEFKYKSSIRNDIVPFSYLGIDKITSRRNINIIDRSYQLSLNSKDELDNSKKWKKSKSLTIESSYNDLLITDEEVVDRHNKIMPLFYLHELQEGTTSCKLVVVTNMEHNRVVSGYKIDLDQGYLFTNYKNWYSNITGEYVLYYVISEGDTGTRRELLNTRPVYREATWEDVDETTGALIEGAKVYTKETSGSGTTYYFENNNIKYYKPYEDSGIRPLAPFGEEPEDEWYMRFSVADLSYVVNGSVKRYWVPEYETQDFFPTKPYIYDTYGRFDIVNERTLVSIRPSLAISPEDGRHLTLFIFNESGTLLRVWTTDSSKEGRKFSDSSISYETDKILSYDNRGGFVSLTERIDPLSKIKGEFFYSSNDLEYRRLNINPIFNSDIKKYMVVFYLIPNVGAEEEAIHYLLVDKKGKIVYTSQGAGGTYPDLSLEGGSWNPDTIVGMNYIDESSDDGFVSLYSIGYDNPFGYLILAECTLKETFGIDEIRKVDLRREGGTLVPSKKKEVYKRNQRLLQSKYGYGESGEEVQHTNVLVIDVPITVLKEYGGDLTRKEVEQNIKRNLSMGVYPLINWKYPRADIVIDQIDSASVSISCEWLGGDYTYTLLRKTGEEDWEVIDYIVAPERGTLEWTDDTISTNTTYMYTIRIELDDLQYPLYNIVTIRTAE